MLLRPKVLQQLPRPTERPVRRQPVRLALGLLEPQDHCTDAKTQRFPRRLTAPLPCDQTMLTDDNAAA